MYVPNQWETTLQCNAVSHWLGAFTRWSLHICLCTRSLAEYIGNSLSHVWYHAITRTDENLLLKWILRNILQWKVNSYPENAHENVIYKMLTTLFSEWVIEFNCLLGRADTGVSFCSGLNGLNVWLYMTANVHRRHQGIGIYSFYW